MSVIIEPPYLDAETGLLVEIVRNAETGEIIGKNERMPEPVSENVQPE
jgi:hypothetical protein